MIMRVYCLIFNGQQKRDHCKLVPEVISCIFLTNSFLIIVILPVPLPTISWKTEYPGLHKAPGKKDRHMTTPS